MSDSDGCSPQDSSHLLLVFLYLFVVILSVLGAVASLCFTWKLSPSQVWFRPGLEDWPCMRYCKTFTEVSWMISGQYTHSDPRHIFTQMCKGMWQPIFRIDACLATSRILLMTSRRNRRKESWLLDNNFECFFLPKTIILNVFFHQICIMCFGYHFFCIGHGACHPRFRPSIASPTTKSA